jgi:hypothetical protein
MHLYKSTSYKHCSEIKHTIFKDMFKTLYLLSIIKDINKILVVPE